jgi:hypothetical protein
LFCSSTFGSRIRWSAKYRAEVRPADGACFFEAGGLSGGREQFRSVRHRSPNDPRGPTADALDDHRRFRRFLELDGDNKRRVVEASAQLDEPALQTIVCVNSETDAIRDVGPETSDQIHVGRARRCRHCCADVLRQLNGKRGHSTGACVVGSRVRCASFVKARAGRKRPSRTVQSLIVRISLALRLACVILLSSARSDRERPRRLGL